MSRFNGNFGLDGLLLFPSGANNDMAVRAISGESKTGQPASGQIRFVQVGNQEGYWYLHNHAAQDLYDFDASTFPSGQRIAILDDISLSNSLGSLSDTVLDTQVSGNFLVFDGTVWVPSGNIDSLSSIAPVDSRSVSGNIIPDTHDVYDLGSNTFKWREIVSSSGAFGNSTVRLSQNIEVTQDASYQGHSLFIKAGATQPFPVRIIRDIGGSTNQGLLRVEQSIANSGDGIQIKYSGISAAISIDANAPSNNNARGIHLSHAAGGSALRIDHFNKQNGGGAAIEISNTGTLGTSISISHATNNDCITINSDGTGSSRAINITQQADGIGLDLNQTGNAIAMQISSNSSNEVLCLDQNSNADTLVITKTPTGTGVPLKISNAGSSPGIQIDQTGNHRGFELNQTGTFHAFSIGTNQNNVIGFMDASHSSFSTVMTAYRATGRTGSSSFSFIKGETTSDGNLLFDLRGDGRISSDIAATTPADYAEYFNTLDPLGIEYGYAVQISNDTGGLIEVATSGENIIGFVSAAPAMIADAAWANWHDRWIKDDFGAYILNERGERTVNPVYNSGLEYTPREDRPEWVAVGLLGKIWVRSYGELMMPGDYACLGVSGMLIKADVNDSPRWPVIASGLSFDITKGYGTVRVLYG
jgi:hypothetical protein